MQDHSACQWGLAGKYNKPCVEPPTHMTGVRKMRMCAKHAYQTNRDLGWKVRSLAGVK